MNLSNNDVLSKEVERRQQAARHIHEIWTRGGSDSSGLAPALLDGRIDVLGAYVTLQSLFSDEREEDSTSTNNRIDRIHCRNLSYEEFVDEYMYPNRPVIIQGLADKWRARRDWICTRDGIEVPDMQYMNNIFGNDIVPVYEQLKSGFGVTRPIQGEITMSDYVDWWNEHQRSKKDDDKRLIYLKDWKFVASYPDYNAYDWPHYFKDDWLNQAMGNAYKFVYLGPAGTSTPLHADVLQSFSWSTNVCGSKRWYLVPPEYTFLLYDCFGRKLASHLHADVDNGMDAFFPGLKKARQHAILIDQEAGETVFVPSSWHHTVENLMDTLSINHNWLNGANIEHSWKKLHSEVIAARSEGFTKTCHDIAQSQNTVYSEEQTTDNSQIGDDFTLLWHVIKKKLQTHEMQLKVKSTPGQLDSQIQSDLSAIIPILRGLRRLVVEDRAPEIVHVGECSIVDLMEQVNRTVT